MEKRNIRFAQIGSILRPFFGKRKERSLQVNAQKISIVVSHTGVIAGLIGAADGLVGIVAGLGGVTVGLAGIAAGHIGVTVILAMSAGRL